MYQWPGKETNLGKTYFLTLVSSGPRTKNPLVASQISTKIVFVKRSNVQFVNTLVLLGHFDTQLPILVYSQLATTQWQLAELCPVGSMCPFLAWIYPNNWKVTSNRGKTSFYETWKNDTSVTIICLLTSGRVGLSKQLTNHFSVCDITGEYLYVSPDAPDAAVIPPENEYYGMSHSSDSWEPKRYRIGYAWNIHTQWDCATACYKAKGCAGWLFHEFSRCKLLDNKNVKYTWSTALTEWYYQLTSGTAGCGGLH